MLIVSIRRTRDSSTGGPISRRCPTLCSAVNEFLIALNIQQILQRAGAAHVACTATAAEATALLRQDPNFDIAVLDVKLKCAERNSFGVATMLAEKAIPFVFLTGMDGMPVKYFPDTPVIEKPYGASDLL